jgi:hypothetical protein
MSIVVHTFDEKRIEKSMNKEQLEYLNAHKQIIKISNETIQKAIKKIRVLTEELKAIKKESKE